MNIKGLNIPKLQTRQMIILGVMIIVILYGLYDLFHANFVKSREEDIGKKSAELNTFITTVSSDLAQGSPAVVQAYMVNRAESDWARNPFRETKGYREWMTAKTPASGTTGLVGALSGPTFTYSGYLERGDRKIAIINGNEYRSGEALVEKGYVLKSITPGRVVIENTETRSDITVPLQD
ncbi:MAG: hypothetical protein PHY31_04555 [Smithellaceae bacterium]|nr:hypothetical protein [Smithellaceae bacterium]